MSLKLSKDNHMKDYERLWKINKEPMKDYKKAPRYQFLKILFPETWKNVFSNKLSPAMLDNKLIWVGGSLIFWGEIWCCKFNDFLKKILQKIFK
jgi:hypothetical protein